MEVYLPNFLIVGAAKSGTTSLYQYLHEHPEIFMSGNKEPRFFISSVFTNMSSDDPRYSALLDLTITEYDEYTKLFRDAGKYKAIGEATATYLYYYQEAIPNIKKYLNDVKIITANEFVDYDFYLSVRKDDFLSISQPGLQLFAFFFGDDAQFFDDSVCEAQTGITGRNGKRSPAFKRI